MLDVKNVAYYFSIMTHDAVGFDSVFQRFGKTGDSVADGAAFEELCCWFLRNAAEWKDEFDAVWRWHELKWGSAIGISLVARRRRDQTVCAVQCLKSPCNILKGHVDAFLAATQNGFSERILIASASGVSPVVASLLQRQKVPVRLILRDDFVEASLDWSPWADGADDRPRRVVLPPPRPPLGGRFLTEERILEWADEHHRRTGAWPKQISGPIRIAKGETWVGVSIALSRGRRGLSGGSSLAKLLAARRGVRNKGALPKLTEEQILAWADEYHRRTGRWPKHNSGAVAEAAGETWTALNSALENGLRGFPGGSSLARLLSDRRRVVRQRDRPKLSEEKILAWADAHRARTGRWPKHTSGPIVGSPGETWGAVNAALKAGHRGLLPGGSTLAGLLAAHRGVRNRAALPNLTEAQILAWADAYHARTGRWPTLKSGPIEGTAGESWSTLDNALEKGFRGFPGGSSLARLLAARRGVRNRAALPKLTEERILAWADDYYRQMGRWPERGSGDIDGSGGERWASVDTALKLGFRGLPGGSSLAKLLRGRRKVRQALTEERILAWADEYHRRTKAWPKCDYGVIAGTNGDRWHRVNNALERGCRGLPGGSSLAKLLFARRGVAIGAVSLLPKLTEDQILAWADEHHRRTGRWPKRASGPIAGTAGETWEKVNGALADGYRGFPGGSSLARLLAARLRIGRPKPVSALPKLTEEQILVWADEHHRRTGDWPKSGSGLVAGTKGITWCAVQLTLIRGRRGLPGGSSLTKLLAARRGVRNRGALPKLTEERILAWADAHRARTGRWPKHDSGAIDGSGGETWGAVNSALEHGCRGLPGGSSLFKLLLARRGIKPGQDPSGRSTRRSTGQKGSTTI
jgi:pyrroloquinoline quinone (PQQ) biosynthesis protein C